MESLQYSFLKKFDQVLDLLQHGHLKQDIDDTLLQKLVTFLHCGNAHASEPKSDKVEQGYLKAIHEKLATDSHVETFLIEVLKSPLYIENPQASVFGLQLLSIFTKEWSSIFIHDDKKHILMQLVEFQMSCMLDAPPSVQVAALHCLSSIAQNHDGFIWLAQQGLLDVGLKYLGAASLYVRKSVIDFLSSCLIMWCHSFNLPTKPDMSMHKVLNHLLQNISVNNATQNQKTEKESCIKIIKESVKQESKVCSWLCKEYHLLDILQNTIKTSTDAQSVQAAVDLILSLFDHQVSRNAELEIDLENILIQHENFEVLINFLSFVLQRFYIQHQEWCQSKFALVCSPLGVVTGINTSVSVPQEVTEMLKKRMCEKETCRKLVRMSLISVSKLISRMENQILKEVISIVSALLQPKSDQWNQIPLQRHIIGCKKTRHAACQLLINCVQPPVKNELDSLCLLSLMDTFLFLLTSPTTDSQLMSHSIQGMGTLIILEASGEKWLPSTILDQLAEVLHRRLADPRWAVVDSALQLLDCLSSQEIAAEQTLFQWLCKHKFPCLVWDIVFSEIDGYVKATAINTLCSFCLSCPLWTYLREQKDGKEDDVIMHFLALVTEDPDTFVRRAAISSLFRLLQVDALGANTTYSSSIYRVLMNISTSDLDWEVKLHALKVWQWVFEQKFSLINEISSESFSTDHSAVTYKIGSFLKILHYCGYGPSLTNALKDHDRTVQQQAAEYLLELCSHLEHLGWSPQVSLKLQKDFKLPTENSNKVTLGSTQNHEETSASNTGISISAADRAEILEEVLDIDTLSQIRQIITVVPNETENLRMGANNSKYAIKLDKQFVCTDDQWIAFVQLLSKKQLEALLLNLSKSSDVYSNEPVSLLDDILAAASSNAEIKNEDFKAMDCY